MPTYYDYVCDDGCYITDLSSAIEPVQLGNKYVTETIDNVCETIQRNLTRMFNISILHVCSLPSKLDIADFIELIQSHAINCFVETKINDIDGDILIIPVGYKGTFKSRRYVSKVKFGGIGIIYKEELDTFITEIKTESDFVASYKIDQTSIGLGKDLLLGVIYIPPEGSKYTKVEAFEECEIELLELLCCSAFICMCGDFNA